MAKQIGFSNYQLCSPTLKEFSPIPAFGRGKEVDIQNYLEYRLSTDATPPYLSHRFEFWQDENGIYIVEPALTPIRVVGGITSTGVRFVFGVASLTYLSANP